MWPGRASSERLGAGGSLSVEVDVENVGQRPGSQVVQLYVAPPDGGRRTPAGRLRPVKQLKGFVKVYLAPGEKQTVTMELNERSFAYYDVADEAWPVVMARYGGRDPDNSVAALHRDEAGWYVDPGRYELLIGTSSAATPVRLAVEVEGSRRPLAGGARGLTEQFAGNARVSVGLRRQAGKQGSEAMANLSQWLFARRLTAPPSWAGWTCDRHRRRGPGRPFDFWPFPVALGVAALPPRPFPAPPPTPEEAALDRWNAGVVMLVAGLSVVGALMAWWASSDFSSASDISQQALHQSTEYQTVQAEQNGYVEYSARLAQLYEGHTIAESTLYNQAATAWGAENSQTAEGLESQARVEGAQERALAPGFICYYPSYYGQQGQVGFNIAQEEATETIGACLQPDQDVTTLRTDDQAHVDALEAAAQAERTKAAQVVLAGAFAIVSVFFLTLAYLGWRHKRARFLAPGVVAIAVAVGLSAFAGWA